MQPFDINMWCGVGHTGLEKFCGFMNMPPPMSRKLFDKLSNNICAASEMMDMNSMIDAAVHLKEIEATDIGVSVGGTWQKRWFSSLNGVATSVSTGKILDFEVLSRRCKSRTMHTYLKETNVEECEKWKLKHNCSLNYQGSSPNMESSGAVSIFSPSSKERGLRYLNYYGDGDSKSFQNVEYIHEGVTITKYECIDHYQSVIDFVN